MQRILPLLAICTFLISTFSPAASACTLFSVNGPDNSIWRTGSRPTSEQPLGTLIFRLQKGQAPEIYVKIRYSPNDQGQEDIFTVDGSQLFAQ